MGNFNIPIKQLIVNSGIQVKLKGDNGTGPADYSPTLDLDPANGSHKVQIEGWLDWFPTTSLVELDTAERIKRNGNSVGSKQQLDCTVQLPSGAVARRGSVFRIVTRMPSLEHTAYQNQPLEKRYTLSKDCHTDVELAEEIVAVVSADKNALVTAAVSATPGIMHIYDKLSPYHSNIYVSKTTDGELPFGLDVTIAVQGKRGYNTYEHLKNLQWSDSMDIDRNSEYYPLKGAKYISYYFRVRREELPVGGFTLPSEVPAESETEFIIYINENLTDLLAQFDAWGTDMNV